MAPVPINLTHSGWARERERERHTAHVCMYLMYSEYLSSIIFIQSATRCQSNKTTFFQILCDIYYSLMHKRHILMVLL